MLVRRPIVQKILRSPIAWAIAILIALLIYQASTGGMLPNADPYKLATISADDCYASLYNRTLESESGRKLTVTICVKEGTLTNFEAAHILNEVP